MIASVDGCKGGWLILISNRWPSEREIRCVIARDFLSVLQVVEKCESIVVDMPIGLSDEPRFCDKLARERLKRQRSSIFLAPPRACLNAKNPEEFQELYRKWRGVGAGYPVWGILPKIREVDRCMTPQLQKRLGEFHPELAWKFLAKMPLASKHTHQGILQRAQIVESLGIRFISWREWKCRVGKAMKLDDMLDAIVGLSVANAIHQGPDLARRLPENPSQDDRGLRMEIWF